jgi:hypothetical protein
VERLRTKEVAGWCCVTTFLLWLFPGLLLGENHAQHKPSTPATERFLAPPLPTAPVLPETTRVAQMFRRLPDTAPQESIPEVPAPESPNIFSPVEDRWRFGYQPNLLNPYKQNVLKGDYPIVGQHTFLVLTGISDTLFEFRDLPAPAGSGMAQPDSTDFSGNNDQLFVRQNFLLRFALFEGDTAFRPPGWTLAVTPVFNINHLDAAERGIVNPDVRHGTDRTRTDLTLQEAFFEYHLGKVSRRYDFLATKVGLQPFNSDFRGFLFNDTNLAARLFGNAGNNRYQYNLLFFEMLEKDSNSELNTFAWRDQQVLIANFYWQDFLWSGYTTQFSVHYNRDQASFHFDDNDFLVRPDPVGNFMTHELNVVYLGWTSHGHIGGVNVSHALYVALGHDHRNPLAGRRQDICGQMFALELSLDFAWLRPKLSFLWASGDSDPEDGNARGFDTILDKPNFAGGSFSFWNRQGIRLLGVGLVQRESLLPNLRSSKIAGQGNFVNPGLLLVHAGLDVEVTPRLRTLVNASYLRFMSPEPLEVLLQQPDTRPDIGFDVSLGFFYRPLLHNNIVLTGGVATLIPGQGFRDTLTSDTLFQVFVNAVFVY